MDTKVFKIGGKNLRVSVLETTKASGPLAKKAKLVEAMTELVKKDKVLNGGLFKGCSGRGEVGVCRFFSPESLTQ